MFRLSDFPAPASSACNDNASTPCMVATPSSLSTSVSDIGFGVGSDCMSTTATPATVSAAPLQDQTATTSLVSPDLDQDAIVHTLRAMRSKDVLYRPSDYLAVLRESSDRIDSSSSSSSSMNRNRNRNGSSGSRQSYPVDWVDEDCRLKMCNWCMQIVDHCNDDFSRDTVAIAMNILDRFLSTPAGRSSLLCRSTFQLTCVTAFYTAVKVHEQCAISVDTLAILSKNVYTVDQLEAMERTIMQAIGWRVHPQTSRMFAHFMLRLVLPDVDANLMDVLQHHIDIQIDHVVQDYGFVGVDASLIAMAAILNALACEPYVSASDLFQVEQLLSYATQLPCQSHTTRALRQQLFAVLARQQFPITPQQPTVAAGEKQQQQQRQSPKSCLSDKSSSESIERSPTSTVRV